MELHSLIESKYKQQTEDFSNSVPFQRLERGTSTVRDYDGFITAVCRTHLKSPHILAFLYSAAPPASAEALKHNLLEELGLENGGVSHPALLIKLASAAGFNDAALEDLEAGAQEELRRTVSDPIIFGTLKEVGLSVLLETTAFEWMLSRLAGRMATFLSKFRGLSAEDLIWFHHHSEVDIRHAEEGLQAVVDYVGFYELDAADLELILEMTFRENVFTKRYFGEIALANQQGVFA